jgi:hypothetical protein
MDSFRNLYQRASESRMAGSARGAVNNAVARAGTAYNSVSRFMPAAGGVLAVAGAGLEAKSRLDRGEDLQRAATGAATGLTGSIAGGAQGAALGSLLGPVGTVVGGIAGAAIGGFGAGYLTDRVTDAVRGNDGKGTDAVLQDLSSQIQQAQAQGNPARASQLMQEATKFQNSRMPAGSQAANNNQLAQQNGVQQSDATEFGNLQSAYRMGKAINEDAFTTTLNNGQRQFEQQFNQQTRMFDDNQRRGQIERLRNQARDIQNKATGTQQDMILNGANAINDYGRTFAQGLSQSYQGGGIR